MTGGGCGCVDVMGVHPRIVSVGNDWRGGGCKVPWSEAAQRFCMLAGEGWWDIAG